MDMVQRPKVYFGERDTKATGSLWMGPQQLVAFREKRVRTVRQDSEKFS